MSVKVKNVNDWLGTTDLFRAKGWSLVDSVEEADIVCLNGGADIATEIYEQTPYSSSIPQAMSHRDKVEVAMYNVAREQGKFILGICRGAQLANCLNGGKLWQHVNNHHVSHLMYDKYTKERILTTSAHHQQMIPGPGADIIAVSSQSSLKVSDKGRMEFEPFKKKDEEGEDIEVLWYPRTRSLCIQGHPEFAPRTPFAEYCFKLTESLRLNNVWPSKKTSELVA